MLFVQFAVQAFQCQIEDFPAEVPVEGKEPRKFERSCEGALHVRPGTSAEITADEFAHIREKHPQTAMFMRVLLTEEQLAASREAPTQPEAAAPPTVPDLGDTGSGGGDDSTPDETPDAKKKSGKR